MKKTIIKPEQPGFWTLRNADCLLRSLPNSGKAESQHLPPWLPKALAVLHRTRLDEDPKLKKCQKSPISCNVYDVSFHIISFHIISCHVISFHVISCHFMSYHFISYHFKHLQPRSKESWKQPFPGTVIDTIGTCTGQGHGRGQGRRMKSIRFSR